MGIIYHHSELDVVFLDNSKTTFTAAVLLFFTKAVNLIQNWKINLYSCNFNILETTRVDCKLKSTISFQTHKLRPKLSIDRQVTSPFDALSMEQFQPV